VISIPSRSARSSSGPEVVIAVDQHALAAGFVGDQIGIRQPIRVLGPLDDQIALRAPY
jgi:hypothetical protein